MRQEYHSQLPLDTAKDDDANDRSLRQITWLATSAIIEGKQGLLNQAKSMLRHIKKPLDEKWKFLDGIMQIKIDETSTVQDYSMTTRTLLTSALKIYMHELNTAAIDIILKFSRHHRLVLKTELEDIRFLIKNNTFPVLL